MERSVSSMATPWQASLGFLLAFSGPFIVFPRPGPEKGLIVRPLGYMFFSLELASRLFPLHLQILLK